MHQNHVHIHDLLLHAALSLVVHQHSCHVNEERNDDDVYEDENQERNELSKCSHERALILIVDRTSADCCLVNHERSHEEEGEKHEDQAQDEALAARDERLRVQLVPVDVVPVEGLLEDPVSELELSALRLRHICMMLGIYSNLTAHLDKLLDHLLVFGKDEGIANVLWHPVLLGARQIRIDLLILRLQFLREVSLRLRCHLAAAAEFSQATGLLYFSDEELTVLRGPLLARLQAQAAPARPAASALMGILAVFFPPFCAWATFLPRYRVVD